MNKLTRRRHARRRRRTRRRTRRRRRGSGLSARIRKARAKSSRAKVKIRKAAQRLEAKKTAFLVLVSSLQLASAARTEISRAPVDEVWVLGCTGNTCRSPALKVAAGEQGFEVDTCGTAPRAVGQPATPALVDVLGGESRAAAQEHVSQACEPQICGGLFDNHGGKVFGVVAEKNAADLRRVAAGCGVTNLDIRVLGDVAPACKPLANDPFFKSQKHVCKNIKDGTPRPCNFQEIAEEKIAYREMLGDARNCVAELQAQAERGVGPSLGRRRKPRRGELESELATTTTGREAHRRGFGAEIGEGAVRLAPPQKQFARGRPNVGSLRQPRGHL